MNSRYDVLVIGSGPAGMAAAISAFDQGASVCLVEREEQIGGILKQCIHDGFGLIRFNEKLTGPEYAWRYSEMVRERGIKLLTRTFLTGIKEDETGWNLNFVSPENGVFSLQAKAIISATGCRERTGRQIFLHGNRPAGIFTAGQAQDFVNLKGYMPGKRAVILGSGDIGLIMARRLKLEGAEVLGVWEIGPVPSGLNRNIAQCLEDFNIPLHLSRTVTEVHGSERVEGVTICSVDKRLKPVTATAERIDCDCLILSVGLIPENDILAPLGVEIDPVTSGPEVDQFGHTSVPGIFSCGNALHVSDLVDYVSESGHAAGAAAAVFAAGGFSGSETDIKIRKEGILRYVIPQRISKLQGDGCFPVFFRPSKQAEKADFTISSKEEVLFRKRLSWLKPSEMQRIETNLSELSGRGNDGDDLVFGLSEINRETSNE